jgi:hypothetical protein
VQKQHDLPNHLLLGPARDDPFRALRADAGHLTKATRLLLDDLEHGFAKSADELLRIDRPDTADHAGAEIFLDPLDSRWRRSLQERGFELDAMRAVVDPRPARLDELAGRDHRRMADEGDEIALAAGFDTQNAEPVLGVVECDPVDQPSQDLGRGARPRRLRHPGMMEIKILGRYRDQTGTASQAALATG